MLTELRFAARRLLRDRSATLAAVLAVALGAGFTVAVFAVAYGVLLRPLPYEHGERLAVLDAGTPWTRVEDWRSHLTTFDRLAAYAREGVVVRGTGDPRLVRIAYVDEWFFDTVAARPLAGRLLTRGDDGAVVVSERFARASGVGVNELLGQPIIAGGTGLTIVGVLPDVYAFPAEEVEAWIPARHARPVAIDRFEDVRRWRLVGLLRSGMPLWDARADVARARAIIQPDERAPDRPPVELLHARIVASARPIVVAFAGAAALVWLVTCASLGTLLVGRLLARRRELAICRALGAGRGRTVASLLSESLLLTTAGTLGGLLLSAIGVRLLESWAAGILPRTGEAAIDAMSLAFAAALALATGVLATASTLPALRRAAPGLHIGAGATRSDRRLRGVLLTVQVALVVILLCGGALLARTTISLLRTDLGLDGRGALVTGLVLTSSTTFRAENRWPLVRSLAERVSGLPGVSAAGIGTSGPADSAQLEMTVHLPGEDGERLHAFSLAAVTPGYLEAIGARVTDGRLFEWRDLDRSTPIVVISDATKRAVMPDREAAGRELPFHLPGVSRERGRPLVAGVIADVRYAGLDAEPLPVVYVLWPEAPLGQGYLAVRAHGSPAATAAAIRAVMRELDPGLPHTPMRTFDEIVAGSVADRRLAALLGVTLALLTFGVALVGLSGAVVRAVEERRREIAIRGALGATPRSLMRLSLSGVAVATAGGLALGLMGALATGGVLRSLIRGVGGYDVLTLGAVVYFVLACAGAVCYVPARRAGRVDPAAALRSD
jgi:putative ABC transport system permease protein